MITLPELLNSSVAAEVGLGVVSPKQRADVAVPVPPPSPRATAKAGFADQLVPS